MNRGILLINTGTPDAPTIEAIKPYLSEFLMDPYIIGAPYLIRKAIVAHAVAMRPKRTVKNYRAFWTPDGSPFMLTSMQQKKSLQELIDKKQTSNTHDSFFVELAMRYGNPSIAAGLDSLRKKQCDDVILLPLYPQYVKVCAETCFKEAEAQLKEQKKKNNWHPRVRKIQSFHHIAAYRRALAEQVTANWTYKPGSKLIVSFHSTLLSDIKKDETYLLQCTQTKDWLANDLHIPHDDVLLAFQSRFDSRAWLSPFTEQMIHDQIAQGITDICVVCPGFVTDNLETLIEVNRDMRANTEKAPTFWHIHDDRMSIMANASRQIAFTYVPALGCNPALLETLYQAIEDALQE